MNNPKTLEELAVGTPFEGLFSGNTVLPVQPVKVEEKKEHCAVMLIDSGKFVNPWMSRELDLTYNQKKALSEAIQALVEYVQAPGNDWGKEWGALETKADEARIALLGTDYE